MTRRRSALALLLLLGSLGACADDFEPFNRLTSLRVLALKSEPAAPGPGETASLTPLVYTPPGVEVESYAWSFCPLPGSPSDGYPCLVTEEELAALFGEQAASVPPFDLGGAQAASLEHSIDPSLLELLCAGIPGAPGRPNCEGGFPVQVKLTVRAAGEEVVAVKSVRLRFSEEQAENENPWIEELFAVLGDQEQLLDDEESVSLVRGEEILLRAAVPEEAAESYLPEGEESERRERLTLTWFVETGDTDFERTGFIDGEVPLEEALENAWEPGLRDEHERPAAALFVVIRDERGGTGWLGARVALEDPQR